MQLHEQFLVHAWASLSVFAKLGERFGPEAFDDAGLLCKEGELALVFDQISEELSKVEETQLAGVVFLWGDPQHQIHAVRVEVKSAKRKTPPTAAAAETPKKRAVRRSAARPKGYYRAVQLVECTDEE